MKWKNIKKAGLTTKEVAKRLKYSNANSFRNSSKYECIMDMIDYAIDLENQRWTGPRCDIKIKAIYVGPPEFTKQ